MLFRTLKTGLLLSCLLAAPILAPVSWLVPTRPIWAQTATNRQADADRLYQEGLQQFNAEKLPAAIDFWEKALIIYREIGDRQGEGNALYELGFSRYWLGKYDQAIADYQQSLTIAKEMGNRQREATLLGYLGDVYFYQGNYAKAIEFCQQSLVLAREIGDQQRQWFSLNRLGESYFAQKDFKTARTYYEQSLTLGQQMGDGQLKAFAIAALGLSYLRLEEYEKALSFLQQGLEYQRQAGDRTREDSTLHLIGFAYYWLNDYGKAIEYYQQSLALARQYGNQKTQQMTLGGLGDTYFYLGDYAKAIEFHQQSLELAKKIGDRNAEGTTLNGLGGDYYLLDDLQQAIAFYQEALAVSRSVGTANMEGNALGGLGQAYFTQGDYSKALAAFEQSLEIFRKSANRYNEGAAMANIGQVYLAQKNYAQAIAAFRERLAISEATSELYGKAQSLSDLGLAFYLAGELAQAEASLREGIETQESIRKKLGNQDALKISLFETQTSPYRLLQLVLVAQKQPEAALEVAERGRARAFVELLAQRLSSTAANPSPVTPLRLEQIRQIARAEKATLVEYSAIDEADKLYIWVVKPTGEIAFRQVDLKSLPAASLTALVTDSRRAIGVRGRGGGLGVVATARGAAVEKEQFQRLHQLLIEPIAELLPANPNEQVIFIPHEALFLIPFAALQSPSGQFLIERHTIRTAPAIQVLELTQRLAVSRQQQQPAPPTPIVVGNPNFAPQLQQPPYELAPLPYAEQEAQQIAAILDVKAWIGQQAAKTAIVQQMPQASLIHFATHGLLDDFTGGGVPGAIALAPSGQDNGLLTASEILDLKLKADLVVLSACDTGRGRITGDGVIGLSRSLITAGVASVMVSLWAVPDASTAQLMTEFYRQLQQNPDRSQALRQAMLKTKQQHPNPRDWAALTLIGEAE